MFEADRICLIGTGCCEMGLGKILVVVVAMMIEVSLVVVYATLVGDSDATDAAVPLTTTTTTTPTTSTTATVDDNGYTDRCRISSVVVSLVVSVVVVVVARE